MPEKIVLAYSGGLDTSVAIRWLKEERGYDVVALTVDVGMDRSREELQSRAMAAGASRHVWQDAQETFIRHFAFPALLAGARYQGHYTLATALSRPLIAREMVAVEGYSGRRGPYVIEHYGVPVRIAASTASNSARTLFSPKPIAPAR